MRVTVDDSKFLKQMNNLVEYSIGFIDGTKQGKLKMLDNLGKNIKELLGDFIDSNARVDPASLHHVYEWFQTGNPEARLFDLDYIVNGSGLSLNGTLTQSRTASTTGGTPFYNKAKIMESGTPVTINPKNAQTLRFEQNGETVFTKGPVTVENPGGPAVHGSFENTFKLFFTTYASQSLLDISGFTHYLTNPIQFKKNLKAGVASGRPAGISAGIKYISGDGK
jgi:hypothetical protein